MLMMSISVALALFPMKYPEYRLSMEAALPSSVQSWLGQQLELRGIDSLIYTRYIISLLQQDTEDLDTFDNEIDIFFTPKLDSKRWKRKKLKKKKHTISEEEKKKKAAIDCLTAVSDEKCGIEKLVEELCIRLKDTASQVSVSPFVNIQSSSSSYESSEESGSEFKNPAQRYYAAFPALHGNKGSPSISPSAGKQDSVWKNYNPLVKPTSGEDQPENSKALPADTPPSVKTTKPSNQPIAKSNSKKKDGSNERQRYPSRSNQAKSNKSKKDKERPKRRYRTEDRLQSWPPPAELLELDPFLIPDNFEEYLHESKPAKRENDDLCTKVESILKGMLLPAPNKAYKDLEDVEQEEPKEQFERTWKNPSPSSSLTLTREDSLSPEHQEQDIWYTQPIDIIFQSQEDSYVSTKPRLYKRTSQPDSLTESGRDDSNSTSSSPICNRTRSDSTTSDNSDDIWAGSVLIPAWLTDELSIDHDEVLSGTAAFSSSLMSSSPNEEVLSSSVKKTSANEKQDSSVCWSLSSSIQSNTGEHMRIWSSNDDAEEYLTPTPTQDLLILSQQQSKETSQNLYWLSPATAAPVSLIDVNYLSNLTSLDIDSQCSSNGIMGRTACLSSLWQSQVLFDVSLYSTELTDRELNNLETSRGIWQFDKEYMGDELAKLWNVNIQKRGTCKGPVWGSDFDKDLHVWVGENSFVMNDSSWNTCRIEEAMKEQCITEFENTLIPEIFIEIFDQDNIDDDVFEETEARNVKPAYDRSYSMNNVPSMWSSDSEKTVDPELSKSFELVPSETSAFDDVPRKLHHVLSEPNLAKYRKEKEAGQPSPKEHLFFSPKTHFRPITPAFAPEVCSKTKQQICNDLFGGITSSKTPYQQYVTDPTSDDESFVPKFKVKNYNKYIQTGDGVDTAGVTSSPAETTKLVEEQTPSESLTIGMIEEIVNDTETTDDYLIRIYEDLDAANNDSAYETDYGLSAVETEQEKDNYSSCNHGHTFKEPHQVNRTEAEIDHGNLGEKLDYGIASLAATFPHFQDWPELLKFYQNHTETDDFNKEDTEKPLATSWHEPSYYDQDQWLQSLDYNEAMYILDNQSNGASDCHAVWSCGHEDQQFLPEKYKGIWSTGQESFSSETRTEDMSSENDLLAIGKLYEESQIENEENQHIYEHFYGKYKQYIEGRIDPDPVLESIEPDRGRETPQEESFFSVKLVNKDKVRRRDSGDPSKECECGTRNSYGSYDLAPMPDEALFSSELEKEWTGPEMQLLLSQHKHSRFQRKPCSFFLEGNCRRSDCKFAHDISNITCRFWEEGGCFKGPLCPFLHGYRSEPASAEDKTKRKVSSAAPTSVKDKFDLQTEEFPDLSSLKASGISKRKAGRSQNSVTSTSKKDKLKRGSNSRRSSSNKENLPHMKKD